MKRLTYAGCEVKRQLWGLETGENMSTYCLQDDEKNAEGQR